MSSYQYGIIVGENGLVICGKMVKPPSWRVSHPTFLNFYYLRNNYVNCL
jgi:hypothetical protein